MTLTPLPKGFLRTVEDSPLFDAVWYTNANPDVRYSGMSAAEHFLRIGLRLNRDPSAASNTAQYLKENPAIAKGGFGIKNGTTQESKPTPKPQQKRVPIAPDTESLREAVDVVVPVYNALEDVKLCLYALARCKTGHDLRVFVINDGSDGDTTRWLRQACLDLNTDTARFELIEHKKNSGYTVAVNTGLRATDAPYVVTLNSDTIVTSYWLDGLVRCVNSAPDIGITGPLSNAASWQNVPELLNADKKFAINALPAGLSPEGMAKIVRRASQQLYPRTPFVNGFCFLMRRAVLDAVGYLDEKAFPKGYGEENDLCIRAQDAGFELAYADDTYVFHAKSKSFGSTQRDALSKAGTVALRHKHTEGKFKALTDEVKRTGTMDRVRDRVRVQIAQDMDPVSMAGPDWVMGQRVLFLLPVKGGGGGVHSVVQEATAMRRMGVTAQIAVRDKHLGHYLDLYKDIPEANDLFLGFGPAALMATASGCDVLVATIFTSMEMVRDVIKICPWVLPAYYAQDYEPLFFEKSDPSYAQAMGSYDLVPGALVFAKTNWIGRTIEANHKARVQKVSPSIDHDVYHPAAGVGSDKPKTGLVITAMIRPRTPRRGAGRTMNLLHKLKTHYGNEITIKIFGCDSDSPEFQDLDHGFHHENVGVLSRPEVAALLCEADLFIDLSDYQAFGRTSLEAMACGTIPVVPAAGGGDEYAIDGTNALVVDTMDVKASFKRITALLDDPAPVAGMRLAALMTAAQYSPRRAAMSELAVMASARARYFAQASV